MNEQAFVERRESDWRRLEVLCAKGGARVGNLTGEELRELVKLYRRTSTDLATVRTRSANLTLSDYLNDLVARAYSILYRQPAAPFIKTLQEIVVLAAQTVRRRRIFVILSTLIFFGSAFFAFGLLRTVPETRAALIPPQAEANFEAWKAGRFEERDDVTSALMSGFYASNNPRVAIIAGAVGAGSFGFLSVLMNFQNGMLIGALAHEVEPVGHLGFLLSSISPHGVPELSGIWIACSAGMLLGWALINPGQRSRGDALAAVGKDAVVLLATSVVLMFIAAPIEGFFSFNPNVPMPVKIVVAVVEAIAWLAFWTYFGREQEAGQPGTPPANPPSRLAR
jgi:uncharacterized membrane protein SpoIIM required for sporulation